MPAKRKISDWKAEEDGRSSVKKRKRTDMDDSEVMQELYDTIRNHKTDDGHLLCEAFVRAPKRRTDPEYYNIVSHPIDLIKIQHKLKSDEYKSLKGFVADVETLIENAKIYYRPDTEEYQDACDLWELFIESKSVLLGEELAEYDGDSVEDEDDDDADEEEAFDRNVEKEKESTESRAEVTKPSSEVSSIVIPGTGSTPTIKLKMASSPPSGEARDVTSKMDTTQAVAESGETAKKPCDDDNTPKETEPIRSLRERRYTYRDFLFPKVVISEKQEQPTKQPPAPEKQLEVEDERPGASCEEDDTSYEELFAAVVTAKDGERCISDMFKVLPSRKKYPDYYDVIQDPIDLKTIAQKIQASEYKCLDDMVKDLSQMIHNAKSFNETGSQIYRDAVTLKKIFTNKKHELDQLRSSQHPIRSERIRTRKANVGQRLSLVIAAMDSDSDKDDVTENRCQGDMEDLDSGAEASAAESEEDCLWVLYRAVKSQKNSLNQRISEPFLRLPSKRIYPDYYEEIKKPMSLLQIQKKLKTGQYADLDHLASDLDLVFENAKRYNMDESKLYKDAVRLQGVMNAKLKELKDKACHPMKSIADELQNNKMETSDQQTINESEKQNAEGHHSDNDNAGEALKEQKGSEDGHENSAPQSDVDEPVMEISHSNANSARPLSCNDAVSAVDPPLEVSESNAAHGVEEAENSVATSATGNEELKMESDNPLCERDSVPFSNSGSNKPVTATSDGTDAAADHESLLPSGTKSAVLDSQSHVTLATQQLPLNHLPGVPFNMNRPAVGQLQFSISGLPLSQPRIHVGQIPNALNNVQIPLAHFQAPFRLPVVVAPPSLVGSQIRVPAPAHVPLQVPLLPASCIIPSVVSKGSDESGICNPVSDADISQAATTSGELGSHSLVSDTSSTPVAGLISNDSNQVQACVSSAESDHLESDAVGSSSSAVISEAGSLSVSGVSDSAAMSIDVSHPLTSSFTNSICSERVEEPASAMSDAAQLSVTSVLPSYPVYSNTSSSVGLDSKTVTNSSNQLINKADLKPGGTVDRTNNGDESLGLGDTDPCITSSRKTTSHGASCISEQKTSISKSEITDQSEAVTMINEPSDLTAVTEVKRANCQITDTVSQSGVVPIGHQPSSQRTGDDLAFTSSDAVTTCPQSVKPNIGVPLSRNQFSLLTSEAEHTVEVEVEMKSVSSSVSQMTSNSPTGSSTAASISKNPMSDISVVQTDRHSPLSDVIPINKSNRSSVSESICIKTTTSTSTEDNAATLASRRSPVLNVAILTNEDSGGCDTLVTPGVADASRVATTCRSSLALASHSLPVNCKAAANQMVAMSRESAVRPHYATGHVKALPHSYMKPYAQMQSMVGAGYQPLQVSYGGAAVQMASPLQVHGSGFRHPGHVNVVGQQVLYNQAGQQLNPSHLPLIPMSYSPMGLPVAHPQYTFTRNPAALSGLPIPLSQPLMHLPSSQSSQAALRQQSMIRQQYLPVAGLQASMLASLQASATQASLLTPQYLPASHQTIVGYPQTMFTPQAVNQTQLVGSPLQLASSRVPGMQMVAPSMLTNHLGVPLILTQPPQPRMRYT